MNDFDRLRPAARQRTSNGLRRPARRRIAWTLTSNPFTVAPCRVRLVLRRFSHSKQAPPSSSCRAASSGKSAERSTCAPVLHPHVPLAATPVSCRRGDGGRGKAAGGRVRDHPAGGRTGGLGGAGGEGADQGGSAAQAGGARRLRGRRHSGAGA